MAFIPVENTVMAEIRFELLGQKVENTLYFLYDSPPTVLNLATLGEALVNWWTINLQDQVSTSATLREVFCTDLTTETSAAISFTPASVTTGGKVGDPMPGGSTLAISFRTAGRGRSSRGRNYFVGLARSQVTGNQVNGGDAELIRAGYQNLIAAAIEEGPSWVVVSRFSEGVPRVAGVTALVTSAGLADTDVDSQRRRLNGRGS